jgi:dimethylargininase
VVDGLRDGGHEGPSWEGVSAEHIAYVAALTAAGVAVEVLSPLEAYPDSVFVEDPALVFPEGAILLRPGAPSRAGEAAELAPVLRRRFERVLAIQSGHADGGDVLVTPGRVVIGLSARTDAEGAEALAEALAMLGRKARIAPTPLGVLHFKSACALLDDETVLAAPAMARSAVFEGLRVLVTAPGEEACANLIRVNDTVLAPAGFPHTLEMLQRHGLMVVTLQTAEIARIDAGLSCMSLRWRSAEA